MRQNNEKKHIILKIIIAVAIGFLIYIGVSDFEPEQVAAEKAIAYGDIQ